jgi:hypothetical protein
MMSSGTVKWFNATMGYGLIPDDGGRGGLMRCRRNVVMVEPRPGLPLRMRSRICAVSTLHDFPMVGNCQDE